MKLDLNEFDQLQSRFLNSKIRSVHAKKMDTLKSIESNMNEKKLALQNNFQDQLDVYIGNRNADIIEQVGNLDAEQIENHFRQQFKIVFGVDLVKDDLFESRLSELDDVLSVKMAEIELNETLLLENEYKLEKYKKCKQLQSEIEKMQHLKNIEYLYKCRF
eukprot:NODE_540_length_6936_cov_0.673102.p5 type:complete len:161 gc:universal NODE_540_length_6936_cov_0.673102:1840-1358(-)